MSRILNRLLNLFYHHHLHQLPVSVNVLSTHLIFTVFSIEVIFSFPSCRSCYLLSTSLLTSLAGSNSGIFFAAEQSAPNCVRSFRSAAEEPNFRTVSPREVGREMKDRNALGSAHALHHQEGSEENVSLRECASRHPFSTVRTTIKA